MNYYTPSTNLISLASTLQVFVVHTLQVPGLAWTPLGPFCTCPMSLQWAEHA